MIIIFSGYNQRAVIAFLRTLEKNNVSNYSIIASSPKDTILLTSYASKVGYIREHKELYMPELLKAIEHIRMGDGERLLLIPSTEALNRFILKNRQTFENSNCIVPLVTQEMYELISDKESFWEYCLRKGFEVPRILDLKKENLPIVAKPKRYYGKDSKVHAPQIINNEREFDDFITQNDSEDFTYQEFIDGNSFYLLFYFEKNGIVHKLSQINYAQQPEGKSIVIAACSNLHLVHPIAAQYEKMFLAMGYHGFVMIELRQRGEHYYMIEANPRFWGPSQLFCNMGYNLFEVFLKEYGYIKKLQENVFDHGAKYLWSGGIIGNILGNKDCVWFGNGKEEVRKHMDAFLANDVYCGEDTMSIYEKEKEFNDQIVFLREVYMKESKHSNYQILSSRLQQLLGEELSVSSRYERERFKYIVENLDIRNKSVLDIGGNTGFFTFESLEFGADVVDYFEGNKNHALFVERASELLGISQRINIYPEYYLFGQSEKKYDIIFCLNVVHHLGSDFAEGKTIKEAKKEIIRCINQMAHNAKVLVFQMGYNWGGNPDECLFELGTKEEMELFIQNETAEFWDMEKIAVAEKLGGNVVYKDATKENNVRIDKLGEFLNRPIFIMRSKVFTQE